MNKLVAAVVIAAATGYTIFVAFIVVFTIGFFGFGDIGNNDDPFQNIYVHSRCAKERMAGATMNLEPSVFGEED